MKTKILLFLLCGFIFQNSFANETEPNDTRDQANTLALNGSNTGAINVAGDVDWWKVTTNADGKLNVTITISNSLYMYCYIYDNDGVIVLKSGNTYNTTTISTDGLAAGTYYLKCYSYYTGQLPAYTISNTLDKPAEANDQEPNNTAAQAKVIPLNNKTTGHINYYYDNKRDTFDWYKVTTNADGRLRLTMTSGNGQYIYAYLYDNDGTTELAHGNTYTSAAIVNKDGLAAGVYYIRISAYYNGGFIPYTLEDSLFTPDQANDPEPNNTSTEAVVFAPNSTITGHTNYYYNNSKDTYDWYKITIPKDGNVNLDFTSNNGQYFYVYFYDNDGTTVIKSDNTYNNKNYNVDGLQAGTYFMRVSAYYSTGFIPYTIKNTFTTYSNANDVEPNNYPYQAKTLDANKTSTGHINFYYNKQRDTYDWFKINYTGSGNLTLNMAQETHISDGTIKYFNVDVYKDTLAGPIKSTNSAAATFSLDLTGLTQDYYYVRISSYYSSDFESYSIENVFTQVNAAKIVFLDSATQNSCGNGSITYKLSNSHAPYMVRLYKNDMQFDSAMVTTNTVKFDGLNSGNYYATVFGDGATGNAFGKSTTISILPPYPTGTNTTDITTSSATLNWNPLSCVSLYKVQYRVAGSGTWTNVNTNVPTLALSGLQDDTKYYWQVRSVDNTNDLNLMSPFSALDSFTTLTVLPVTFINFDGVLQNGNAILNWSTANEINNKGFEVEKSTNGQTFTDIGFVPGNNNSSTTNSYTFTDVKVVSGANYYRLKQIDNDGTFEYSSVIKLNYSAFDWSILGNPVANNSWIQLQLDKSANVSIQIYSMNGNIIATINKGNLLAGTYSIPINLAGKSAGMYVVRLMVDGQTYSKKIIK
ncbi:MAG: T9SS type A sorting domain-containing protein [Chitinophagaceae bacterium]